MLCVSYVLGVWCNQVEGYVESWLCDVVGQLVYVGVINIGGQQFIMLIGGDFVFVYEQLLYFMQGVLIKSCSGGIWDWEVVVSCYDYCCDDKWQNVVGNFQLVVWMGGVGMLVDGSGIGWNMLVVKGVWCFVGMGYVVDLGLQQDCYYFVYLIFSIFGNYFVDEFGVLVFNVSGDIELWVVYFQDVWLLVEDWKVVLGLCVESWGVCNGYIDFFVMLGQSYLLCCEYYFLFRVVLFWQVMVDMVFKVLLGCVVCMLMVGEFYGVILMVNL